MHKIIPAVLSENLKDYKKAFELFESFPENDKVHIDIMDGKFVETISADLSKILQIETKLKRQVHLMVEDPEIYFKICADNGVEEVAFHFGANYRDFDKIDDLQAKGMEIYLAVNPEENMVDIPILQDILKAVDGILVMTVHPGKQGAEFLPSEIMEILNLKQLGYEGKIIEDGHVNMTNINILTSFEIDEFVVGSGIIKQDDPVAAYERLVAATSE